MKVLSSWYSHFLSDVNIILKNSFVQNMITDIVLMDVDEPKLKGEVLDLNHGNLFLSGVNIEGGRYSAALAVFRCRIF